MVLLVGVNLRIYRAAQAITRTGANVGEVTANLDEFSPLATFGRERLLNVMSNRWDSLNGFERIELIPEMQHVADQAFEAEPDNMDLHFAVARFYRATAPNFLQHFELARAYLNRGAKLGPHTATTAKAYGAQVEAEVAFLWKTSKG